MPPLMLPAANVYVKVPPGATVPWSVESARFSAGETRITVFRETEAARSRSNNSKVIFSPSGTTVLDETLKKIGN